MTMSVYFAKMKRLANTLAIASKPVEHVDLITCILTELESQECESLVTSLLARGENMLLQHIAATNKCLAPQGLRNILNNTLTVDFAY